MIDDCVKLVMGARLIRACIEEGGRGVVLAHHQGKYWVWRVFRPKGGEVWSCFEGKKFRHRDEAEFQFALMVEDYLPQTSCAECGYYFDDAEEGCDSCASKKIVQPTTVGVGT